MRKIFILDTSVLLDDPRAFLRLQDNTVIIPAGAVEEIDKFKGERTARGYNARECSRLLDQLTSSPTDPNNIPLPNGGKLSLLANHYKPVYINRVTQKTSRPSPDSRILAIALQLKEKHPNTPVILISRDTIMRVRARTLEIHAEDYRNARITTDVYTGITEVQSIPEPSPSLSPLPPNHYIITTIMPNKILRWNGKNSFIPVREGKVWGIHPRTTHQIAFLDALLCPEITCVTANGTAGTGKTLLALAAGLAQVENKIYRKVIVARPAIPMGRDIGYLPGEAEDKTRPFLGPIWDNLSLLEETTSSPKKGQLPFAQSLQKSGVLEVGVLSYFRGRSLPYSFILIDEAQNLTPLEAKTIVTRAGQGAKVVLTGDITQIDNPYLDATSNGLTYVAERLKNSTLHRPRHPDSERPLGAGRGSRTAAVVTFQLPNRSQPPT